MFYDQSLTKVSEKELDFDWLDEFNVNNFPGSTTARQGEARRLRLYQIICANRDNDVSRINQSPGLGDPELLT